MSIAAFYTKRVIARRLGAVLLHLDGRDKASVTEAEMEERYEMAMIDRKVEVEAPGARPMTAREEVLCEFLARHSEEVRKTRERLERHTRDEELRKMRYWPFVAE